MAEREYGRGVLGFTSSVIVLVMVEEHSIVILRGFEPFDPERMDMRTTTVFVVVLDMILFLVS